MHARSGMFTKSGNSPFIGRQQVCCEIGESYILTRVSLFTKRHPKNK